MAYLPSTYAESYRVAVFFEGENQKCQRMKQILAALQEWAMDQLFFHSVANEYFQSESRLSFEESLQSMWSHVAWRALDYTVVYCPERGTHFSLYASSLQESAEALLGTLECTSEDSRLDGCKLVAIKSKRSVNHFCHVPWTTIPCCHNTSSSPSCLFLQLGVFISVHGVK